MGMGQIDREEEEHQYTRTSTVLAQNTKKGWKREANGGERTSLAKLMTMTVQCYIPILSE